MVAQWLRIHLAMQETLVTSLARELRSHEPKATSARVPRLRKPMCPGARALHKRSYVSEMPAHRD